MISCEKHPGVPYAASFLNIAKRIVRFFCEDCATEYRKIAQTEYKSKRESWETQYNDMEWIYQGRTGSELHQGKWK